MSNYIDEPDVAVGDDVPSIIAQAEKKGWAASFFDFGKAENPGVENFNPGLVRRPDGLWLLVRRSEIREGYWYGKNSIWACKIGENKKVIGGPMLLFPESGGEEQFEDPRAVYWQGQTWIGCCNFTWFLNGSWTGAHQMLGIFKDGSPDGITEASWTPVARRDPEIGTNSGRKGHTQGRHNKNLLWWFHEDKLHCLYLSDPWQVVEFGTKWDLQTPWVGDGVKWKYGIVRGGTPPVLIDGLYYTFFHSSIPWRGRYRRYYMGAIAFESTPPFKPVQWTREPLLTASQNDPWHQRKPLVVFPCGSVMENQKWLVTLGVNDLKCAWVEIPHQDLLKLLQSAPVIPGLSLLSERTLKFEGEPIPFSEEDARGGDVQCAAPVLNRPTATVQSTEQISDAAPTSKPESAAVPRKRKKNKKKARKVMDPALLEKLRANMAKARAAKKNIDAKTLRP